MRKGREQQVDFLVAGSGIAGLRAAAELAAEGTVLVLDKSALMDSAAGHAEANVCQPASEEELGIHPHETLRSGDGLSNEEAVRVLAEEGPQQIRLLAEWGARFEARSAAPQLVAGGSRRARAAHAPAGAVGSEIHRTLAARAKTFPSIRIRSHAMMVDLILEDGEAGGAIYLDEESHSLRTVRSKAVLLATGGLGRVYAETTNPPGACGDGVAIAFRAGATLSDLEFIQFHPTVLCSNREPRLILSPALRERGAILRNLELERFMPHYHETGELAPADLLSRAILSEMQKGRSDFVYLDLTAIDPDHVKKDFPHLYAACLESNIDITSDLVPTRPAAHFAIGGVATSLEGATSLGHLFAAGELASTGVHGANRRANDSLLEGLVFGARAAHAMIRGAAPFSPPPPPRAASPRATSPTPAAGTQDPAAAQSKLQLLMWEKVGIMRHGTKLKQALNCLDALEFARPHPPDRQSLELENLLLAARLITCCAEARKESRGTHYRADYPLRNDAETPKHSFISNSSAVYFR